MATLNVPYHNLAPGNNTPGYMRVILLHVWFLSPYLFEPIISR